MSDHTAALVPLKAWAYLSPDLNVAGKYTDIGLLCEALIYYDHVFLIVDESVAFSELLNWFITQNLYNELISLISDGTIQFYHYLFRTAAVWKPGETRYTLANVQTEDPRRTESFDARIISRSNLNQILPHARQRARLYGVMRDRLIEVSSRDFGPGVHNAVNDFEDNDRMRLLVQHFVDYVYECTRKKHPPVVLIDIVKEEHQTRYTWNVDLNQVVSSLGIEQEFHPTNILLAAGVGNHLIWSAAQLSCDVYLYSPMSRIVGDKLYESNQTNDHPAMLLNELKTRVEFPDVRGLVNSGLIGFDVVLELRKHGNKFRKWLQNEGERDRDAIVAYHAEVAKNAGFSSRIAKNLAIFGVIGAAGGGAVVGTAVGGDIGGALGLFAGGGAGKALEESVKYVLDVGGKLGEGWRPVMFGDWAHEQIEREMESKRTR